MKIGLGADPFGLELKEAVKQHLLALGHECVDLGGTADQARPYYEVAHDLAKKVGSGEFERGILTCGTGMGMTIVANKHRNVYAVVCEDPSAAVKARSINNANILTLGGMITAPYKAKEIIDAFLGTTFKSGWDNEIQAFLDRSMLEIERIESEEFKDPKQKRERHK
ncbi:MAG TPA: RpiB/LacA/LacB family sugar-phosphate isomerase [Candidatus Binatia bacterium]|nr:RpiB/LacA/LacB family sugar-phosphate isomerase [Candidatus Binatia bacterium]